MTGGASLSAGETGEAGLERARAVGTGIVSPTSGLGVLCCPLSGEASEGWRRQVDPGLREGSACAWGNG